MNSLHRVVISGGGTGGHIHPALAIADEIRSRYPDCDIQFVGALGRMEMEKVPAAGYPIEGLWISGFNRNWKSLANLSFPFKLISSLWRARRIVKRLNPDIAIGVGGFASGPILYQAAKQSIPTLIQEQNGFPGVTNRILASRVDCICAGFPGLERWFPADRIVETGNPLRAGVMRIASGLSEEERQHAFAHFKLGDDRPVVFILGGSLGAQSMNDAVQRIISSPEPLPYQLIWQCGARFEETMRARLPETTEGVTLCGFIDRMDWAYAISDLIASRSGAMSIAELSLVGKPTILVPSPHVAEDHQTKNARSLTDRKAAEFLTDLNVVEELGPSIMALLDSPEQATTMAKRMSEMARPDAAKRVVDAIEKLVFQGKKDA